MAIVKTWLQKLSMSGNPGCSCRIGFFPSAGSMPLPSTGIAISELIVPSAENVIEWVAFVALLERDADDRRVNADWDTCSPQEPAQQDRRDVILVDASGAAR